MSTFSAQHISTSTSTCRDCHKRKYQRRQQRRDSEVMSAEFSPILVSSDVPTPFEFYYTSAPSVSFYPTPAPTQPYPINTYSPQNPNEVPIIRFVVYLSCTIMILAFILYLNKRNPSTAAAAGTTNGSAGSPNEASQNQVDLVKSMSAEERKEYVTNFLKTQKFVDDQDQSSVSASASTSFRVAQSSSLHIDAESDIESNMPGSNASQTFEDVASPKAFPSCAICLDRFRNGEDICLAQNKECPHEFHLECLFPWLLKSQDCPCCRRDYLSIEPIPPSPSEPSTTTVPQTTTTN